MRPDTVLRHSLLPALLLVLSACAGTGPRAPAPVAWEQHSRAVAAMSEWTANGKLALRHPEGAESASMVWRQAGSATRLHLSGPLGAGATTIVSDGEHMEVKRNGEHHLLDISTPEAVYRSTGWELPLQALPHWLRGLPSPRYAVQQQQLDADGALLARVLQDGWDVSFQQYGQFDGLTLPTRLTIESGDTRLTAIIRQWRAGGGE